LWPSLPAGYVDYDRGWLRVIASRLELEEMVALLTGPERDAVADVPGGEGRGGARRVVLPGGKAVYLRKYLRGGLPRHFVKDLFLLRPPRPLRELVVTEAARAAGCPVPTVLAVCIEDAGPCYRGWIVTEAIDGARPLIDVYLEADAAEQGRLLAEAGRAIRSLHDAGVYHVDLTGHNVLVVGEGEIRIVDFDRALVGRPNLERRARRGLDRFWRSLRKLCRLAAVELPEERRRAIEEGYRSTSARLGDARRPL
jgi:tRNA A-37 threonylcarbamoyl transferase component Bud32